VARVGRVGQGNDTASMSAAGAMGVQVGGQHRSVGRSARGRILVVRAACSAMPASTTTVIADDPCTGQAHELAWPAVGFGFALVWVVAIATGRWGHQTIRLSEKLTDAAARQLAQWVDDNRTDW
jgi:hypothetical protein